MGRLDIKVCGLMAGCIWSAGIFILGFMTMAWWEAGDRIVKLFSTVYIGYRANLLGCLIGAFWGFIDGAITGVLIAWIYNKFFA